MENFEGREDYVPYEREYTEEGYYIEELDGTRTFYPNPPEEEPEVLLDETPEGAFDKDAVEEELGEDEARYAAAERAGSVLSMMKKRKDNYKPNNAKKENEEEGIDYLDEDGAQAFYINEQI